MARAVDPDLVAKTRLASAIDHVSVRGWLTTVGHPSGQTAERFPHEGKATGIRESVRFELR